MQYPVVIFKDPDSIYGIVVLDLPGCITAGDTVEQVLTRAEKPSNVTSAVC